MNTRLPLSALAISPLLLALAPAPADVSFHPDDGSEVTRDFTIDMDFELGDLSVVVDGQDMSEMLPADFEGTAEIDMKVTESFVRSEAGRPLELIRTFLEMRGEVSAMGESESMDDIDKLEGKSVRFVWDEDAEDYEISYHESEGDQADLDGLSADMDMRALLPGKDVSEGDVWTVDARELASVFFFGAKMEAGDAEFDEMFEAELLPQLESMLDDFETTCEYQGERDVDGHSVGSIALKMHGEGSIDLAAAILSAIEVGGADMEVDLDIEAADMTIAFDSTGELLWDLEGGHLHAFDMSGDVEFAMEVSISADVAGDSHYADADAEMFGSVTWKVAPTAE